MSVEVLFETYIRTPDDDGEDPGTCSVRIYCKLNYYSLSPSVLLLLVCTCEGGCLQPTTVIGNK